jgi:hypothetical protein
LLEGVEFDEEMKPKFNALTIGKSQDEVIKQMVVRIGDKTEGLVEIAKELRVEVFEELLKKLDEIRNDKTDKKKL